MIGNRSFLGSFGFAFRGLAEGWRCERNFRVQCGYFVVVLALLAWLKPGSEAVLPVLLAMGLLLAAELMNSALERTVDLVVQEFHPLARSAKDLAAASVLVVAIATAVLNLWVLLPLLSPHLQGGLATAIVGTLWARFGSGVNR